jgi:regulator of CtrA degradation
VSVGHIVSSVAPHSNLGETVSFAEHFTASEQFDVIFKDGMALVERTAAYLDGAGRKDSKALSAAVNVVYATESMRLTTRLLELASWLLMRRALKSGEITAEEAHVKRRRIRLGSVARPAHVKGFAELPQGLRRLIEESFALQDRIVRIDRALEAARTTRVDETMNPVGSQIAALEAAFGGVEAARPN